jgi:hypothetical protein
MRELVDALLPVLSRRGSRHCFDQPVGHGHHGFRVYSAVSQPTPPKKKETSMAVVVKPLPDGPLMVKGEGIEVLDPQGNPVPVKGDAAYLCRCGASATKPMCDGSHKKVSFKG